MNFHRFIFSSLAPLFCGLLFTGCAQSHTSPYQPGPVAGQVVGYGAGTVAGNVAGFGVGAVQGTAHGVAQSFNPNYHVVRYWRTEVTSDGRQIQVPYDVLVDQYGRPVHMPAPTGNPAPPPGTLAAPVAPVAPVAPMTSTNDAVK
jgi:hypothetical protein